MNPTLHHIAIIGIGSPFGADRLGWQASELLQQSTLQQIYPELHITFHQSDRPGAQLLQLLRDCDSAIIIDAMQSGYSPGTLHRFSFNELATEDMLLSTHGFGVTDALALGSTLDGDSTQLLIPKYLTIVGIEIGESVVLRARELLVMVNQILNGWLEK